MAGPEKNPGGSAADVAPVAAPCRNITGRFAEDCGFCCTDVHLEAEGTNINDGTNVEFKIVNQTNGEHVTSANGRMNDGKVRDVQWSCRKTDGYKPGDTYTLQITAGQCQAKGENEFSIIELQDIPLETICHNIGMHKYEIKFEKYNGKPSVVIIEKLNFRFVEHRECYDEAWIVNINTNQVEKVYNYRVDDIDDYNYTIQKYLDKNLFIVRRVEPEVIDKIIEIVQKGLSNKFSIRLRKCKANGEIRICDITIIIVVQQDPNGETINLWKTTTRADSSNWGQDYNNEEIRWAWLHEAGHTLGWYDEYETDSVKLRFLGNVHNHIPDRNNVNSNDTAEGIWWRKIYSLMGVKNSNILRCDYYQQYRSWFENHCIRFDEQ